MSISYISAAFDNNASGLNNSTTVASVAAVTGDKILFLSYWRQKAQTITAPLWNGQTFTQIGSTIDTGEASLGLYELTAASSTTASVTASYSDYVYYNTAVVVTRDSAVGAITTTLSTPQIYNSGGYTNPSITVSSVPTGALLLDFLAAMGWDTGYGDVTATTWTPNQTSRGGITNTGQQAINRLAVSSAAGAGSNVTTSWAPSADQPMYTHLAMYLDATPSYAIDTITNPSVLGSSGNVINTTGLGTLTSLTIGGKAVSSLSATGGDGTYSIPAWADTVQGFLLGSGQTVVASDGTNSANSTVTVNPETNTNYVTLTSVNTSAGYLGSYMSLNIGDQVKFPTAASLSVATNYIDVDSGIYTDYIGSQVIYVRNVTTGIVTQVSLITGVSNVSITGLQNNVSLGIFSANGAAIRAVTGNQVSVSLGSFVAKAGAVTVTSGQQASVQLGSFSAVGNPTTVTGTTKGTPTLLVGISIGI